MAHSLVTTSAMTMRVTATHAPMANSLSSSDAPISSHVPAWISRASCATAPARKTAACHLKYHCCPKQPARKILRSIHQGAQHSARHLQNRCLCDHQLCPKEGGNAVRSSQTHHWARPTATKWAKWSKRRVHNGRNRSKPSQTSQAGANPSVRQKTTKLAL